MATFHFHSLHRRLVAGSFVVALGVTGIVLSGSSVALADPPSADDVNQARYEEQVAQKSVDQIEVMLANADSELQNAMQSARYANGMYELAVHKEQEAEKAAEQAKKDAETAQVAVKAARQNVGQVATSIYRSGGGALSSVTPYLQSDGLESVAVRKVAIDLFGSQADAKMQTYTAAKQVADVLEMNAKTAYEKAQEARAVSQTKKAAAEAAVAVATEKRKEVDEKKSVLVAELARRHHRTVKVEEEYRQEQERQERERQRKAAEAAAAAAAAAANSGGSSYSPPSYSGGSSSIGGGALAYARSMIGIPYVWGGTSWSGVDCSGLVQLSYRSQGIYLPRLAHNQFYYGHAVSFANARPGDLIGFADGNGYVYHIAIYAGGNMMVEAPAPGYYVHETYVPWGSIIGYMTRPY